METIELKKSLKNIMAALLPYLCVILAACQTLLQALNSTMECVIKQEYSNYLNTTSPILYNNLNSSDIGSVSIALSAIVTVFTFAISLYGDQLKKKSKALLNDNTNLTEQITSLSMWRNSVNGAEPYGNESNPSPIESVKTAYPTAILIPDEHKEEA